MNETKYMFTLMCKEIPIRATDTQAESNTRPGLQFEQGYAMIRVYRVSHSQAVFVFFVKWIG
jgi:hypothetical protein